MHSAETDKKNSLLEKSCALIKQIAPSLLLQNDSDFVFSQLEDARFYSWNSVSQSSFTNDVIVFQQKIEKLKTAIFETETTVGYQVLNNKDIAALLKSHEEQVRLLDILQRQLVCYKKQVQEDYDWYLINATMLPFLEKLQEPVLSHNDCHWWAIPKKNNEIYVVNVLKTILM